MKINFPQKSSNFIVENYLESYTFIYGDFLVSNVYCIFICYISSGKFIFLYDQNGAILKKINIDISKQALHLNINNKIIHLLE
jgi:hypothetical protein|nr:MAG TPA: hypothetical protein [Caudoviricetes sp.]